MQGSTFSSFVSEAGSARALSEVVAFCLVFYITQITTEIKEGDCEEGKYVVLMKSA